MPSLNILDQTSPCSVASPLTDRELLTVQKPAQYLGGEVNSIVKSDASVDVHFALAFPDTYEVGMSHLGFPILYEILNNQEATWAERVFMPMADMEALLRDRGQTLRSLEAKRPLAEFDVVGFSLQYELCATNILAMLELSGISRFAVDRTREEPLVIGGGPYSYHPDALSPFFDAFFLGDAEEAVLELVDAIRRIKKQAGWTRADLLSAIAKVEGIYLPSQFEVEYGEDGRLAKITPLDSERPVITRRLLPTMAGAPYPKKPVVPNIQTVHNRLSVEVMRGCVRGCRFCQAGYLYRPQRERTPQEVVEMIQTTLPQTGYEEVSLLSLSTADYCSVVPLLKSLMDKYAADDKIAISFPSTRVDALTPEVLEQVQRVRRTGFTVAPEGGTQRLRDVINKGVSDDQIVETCLNVFRMGWSGIKLYFMLGLPTETDEDLEGIIDLAHRLRALPEARGKDITVSVSTFVPKPHTPFQWAEQITPTETIRRQRLLADGLKKARVTFRHHDPFSSFLEGIFCRAGRELAPVIVKAYELGCRLDAWQDCCREELWMQAFEECNVNPYFYLRERDVEEALPWDHLSCGISKEYFAKEWKRATRAKVTPDCLKYSCSICGACDYDTRRNVLWPRSESEVELQSTPAKELLAIGEDVACRMRLEYRKQKTFRFLGHLELVAILHRAARRANVPLSFTRGFHPKPRLSFGPPLQLGISSESEFVDAYLCRDVDGDELTASLNAALPEGLSIARAWKVNQNEASVQESLAGLRYRVRWLSEPRGKLAEIFSGDRACLAERTPELLALDVQRVAGEKGGQKNRGREAIKTFPLAQYVQDITFFAADNIEFPDIEFTLRSNPSQASPKPLEIVGAWSELQSGDFEIAKVASFFRPPVPKNATSVKMADREAVPVNAL